MEIFSSVCWAIIQISLTLTAVAMSLFLLGFMVSIFIEEFKKFFKKK